jgi:hypothetical protein
VSIEEQKLTLERDRLDFENKKHDSDVSSKRWSQAATFFPIVLLILTFLLNQCADRNKQELEQKVARHTEQIRFVDKQLAEFYYPVKMRLERDNAVWELSKRNDKSPAKLKIAENIEAKMLIPNHEEVMDLIKSKFHLLQNDTELVDLNPLIAAMNRYQRHVTIYKTLRQSNDPRFPAEVCGIDCKYPKEFELQINERIKSLQEQRSRLIKKSKP